jgi:hypothetical protein
VRRSKTLAYIQVITSFMCSRMRPDGFGGCATFITVEAVTGKSTNEFLEQLIALLYNHLLSIAFTIVDPSPTGENLHPATIRQAILTRLASCDDAELYEAIGCPEDSYEVPDDPPAPEEEGGVEIKDG